MCSTSDAGRQVVADLTAGGYSAEDLIFVSAAEILANVANTIGAVDGGMPSVGSERGIVRQHKVLAKQGQVGVMAYAPSDEETERVMTVARRVKPCHAQKYDRFAIVDLD